MHVLGLLGRFFVAGKCQEVLFFFSVPLLLLAPWQKVHVDTRLYLSGFRLKTRPLPSTLPAVAWSDSSYISVQPPAITPKGTEWISLTTMCDQLESFPRRSPVIFHRGQLMIMRATSPLPHVISALTNSLMLGSAWLLFFKRATSASVGLCRAW